MLSQSRCLLPLLGTPCCGFDTVLSPNWYLRRTTTSLFWFNILQFFQPRYFLLQTCHALTLCCQRWQPCHWTVRISVGFALFCSHGFTKMWNDVTKLYVLRANFLTADLTKLRSAKYCDRQIGPRELLPFQTQECTLWHNFAFNSSILS